MGTVGLAGLDRAGKGLSILHPYIRDNTMSFGTSIRTTSVSPTFPSHNIAARHGFPPPPQTLSHGTVSPLPASQHCRTAKCLHYTHPNIVVRHGPPHTISPHLTGVPSPRTHNIVTRHDAPSTLSHPPHPTLHEISSYGTIDLTSPPSPHLEIVVRHGPPPHHYATSPYGTISLLHNIVTRFGPRPSTDTHTLVERTTSPPPQRPRSATNDTKL